MMSSISSIEFFTYISVALLCYYLIIVTVYYKNELLEFRTLLFKLTSGRPDGQKLSVETQAIFQPINEPVLHETFKPGSDVTEHTMLNELLEKLGHQIASAAERNLIKEELLVSLQLLLKQFSNLKYSSFVSSIESYINPMLKTNAPSILLILKLAHYGKSKIMELYSLMLDE